MSIKQRAWWFEPEDGTLGYEDNRVPQPGITHTVDGTPEAPGWLTPAPPPLTTSIPASPGIAPRSKR